MSGQHILLVRHPETLANIDGRFVGRGDSAYTPRGEVQIMLLARRIAAFEPDVLLSSPLRRTRRVAEAAFQLMSEESLDTGEIIFDERLTELDFGDAEGLTWEETQERGIAFEFKRWEAPVAAGGESRRDIFERTAAVLDEALAGDGRRIAIVTHGGVFRSALPHLLGLPNDAIWHFDIRNGSVAECRMVDGHGLLVEFVTLG